MVSYCLILYLCILWLSLQVGSDISPRSESLVNINSPASFTCRMLPVKVDHLCWVSHLYSSQQTENLAGFTDLCRSARDARSTGLVMKWTRNHLRMHLIQLEKGNDFTGEYADEIQQPEVEIFIFEQGLEKLCLFSLEWNGLNGGGGW